jgi:TonB family protein
VAQAGAREPAPPVLSPPVVRRHREALYPKSKLAAGLDVIVVLQVVVDREGHVAEASVETSQGEDFDQAALFAVRQWEFFPAERDGKPVPARIRVPFHFAPPAAPLAQATPAGPKPASPQRAAAASTDGTHEHPKSDDVAAEEHVHTEEVRVTGRQQPSSRGASDIQFQFNKLGEVPHPNASHMLRVAPGILLTNEGGDGHAEQVFLRGFDAREGQDIEFSVNGVPINESGNLHANGYADTHFILPELVTGLRVLEGPFDPRQGNYAVAGSADFQLGLRKRGLTAKYTHGSFNTKRLVLLFGPKDLSEHTFGGGELYETDGFGQNRSARRATAMAQYEGRIGEQGTYRFLGTAYGADYQSAGLLRIDDVSAGRKGFYDTYDVKQGGQSTRFSLAADFETKSGGTVFHEQLFLTQRGMRVQENFTGFLLDVQRPSQSPHGQRGDLIDRDITSFTVGNRGFARLQAQALGQRQEAEFGYFARFDTVTATQYRVGSSFNAPYQLDLDNRPKLVDIGVYADASLRPLKWVTLKGGLRADLFTFDILNGCAIQDVRRRSETRPETDQSCLTQGDFGAYREPVNRATTSSAAFMPRATLLLGPFSGFQFSMNYGQGVRAIDPIYVYNDVKTPFASIDAYELGATYSKTLDNGTTLLARSIFFQTHVDRDLVFSQTEGRNTLANGTTRTGWVGAMRATGSFFDQAANVTFVRSSFDDTGLLVPYVPDVVVRSDTALYHDLPWVKLFSERLRGTLASGITYVGRRALPFGERSNTIFTLDVSASLAWRMAEVSLSATNLLDAQYRLGEYNFVSDWQNQGARPSLVPTRHFAAGAPRALFLTLTLNLGGGA